jgi:hypothetical protein
MYAAVGLEKPHAIKKYTMKTITTRINNPLQPPLARSTPHDIAGLAMLKLA